MAQLSEVHPTATIAGGFLPETARGTPGFFRAARDANGRWWLIDPEDRLFFCRAVSGVREAAAGGEDGALARLQRWGFNSLGPGSDEALCGDGLAWVASVGFSRAGQLIRAPGGRLPDVFDARWPEHTAARAAERCAPHARDARLIGWLTDEALGWAQPDPVHPARPTLLQICLSLEPAFAAYHAAWEFVLTSHGGRLDSMARAWGVPLANKETVREHTRAEQGFATRGYLRDHTRWTTEVARRYFTTTAAAIRAVDPQHLVLGCGPGGASTDMSSVDVAWRNWRELAAPHGPAAMPVLAADFCWADAHFLAAPAGGHASDLTSLERMLRRGRTTFARMARHPAVAGYVWPQWLDEPGEQPPFARGLVHGNGAEAREHTELLAALNARAEPLRRGATRPVFP